MNNKNLPIELKNNQLAVNKRINKRRIESIKKIGKIAANLGISMVSLSGMLLATSPIATSVGAVAFVLSATNAGYDMISEKTSKDSMFRLRKKANGEILISQDLESMNLLQKIRDFTPVEKGAVMGLQLLTQLQSIKQQYEDKGVYTEPARNEKDNVYSQIYSTETHGINIKTVEALEQLGYVQIERKEPSRKSSLIIEKLALGQYKDAMQSLVLPFSKKEKTKNEIQMYDMAIKITDKPIDFEHIYNTYMELSNTKEKNPIRKPITRLGIIFEALRDRNIDIQKNEIGEVVINYNAQESFSKRMKREQEDPCAEYRKKSYIGDKIEHKIQTREIVQEVVQKKEMKGIEH